MTGPREEDGDYAREFFDSYEKAAESLRAAGWAAWHRPPNTVAEVGPDGRIVHRRVEAYEPPDDWGD